MAVNYDCVASIRTVASIRPQSNSSAFRALSANFKLKQVYLSRNCSSHVFAKRDGQASLESIWEIGSKKLSLNWLNKSYLSTELEFAASGREGCCRSIGHSSGVPWSRQTIFQSFGHNPPVG